MHYVKKNPEPCLSSWRGPLLGAAAVVFLVQAQAALADAPPDGRIGYAVTYRYFTGYETEEGTECPQGLNDGPRELYVKQFPDDGTERTVVETQLKREGQNWHPTTEESPFPFYQPQTDIADGLNLDGEIGPEDYTSPDGVEGIDNQLYRAVGCTMNYRSDGSLRHFINVFMWRYNSNRWMIELTGVDDLANDEEVTVTTYRGLDPLLADATGEGFVAGGTQNVDMRWGRQFIEQTRGKIVDGVLITEPIDEIEIPWGSTFDTNGYQTFQAFRFHLNLKPDSAEGLMAGYVNVDKYNHHLNTTWSTHHQSYGQESSSLHYPVLRRVADAYPDPETGENMSVSMALRAEFVQVFVRQPDDGASPEVLSSR